MSVLDDGVHEYYLKKANGWGPLLKLGSDGFYRPSYSDRCRKCEDAKWVCPTGAHVKSMEHIALKLNLRMKDFERAILRAEFVGNHEEPEATVESSDVAYKCLHFDTDAYVLRSPTQDEYVWQPGGIMMSKCSQQCGDDIEADCGCGIYCFWTYYPADMYSFYDKAVVARLQLGGTVVEYTEGARAQYATITAIMYEAGVSEGKMDFLRTVALAYGVRVEQYVKEKKDLGYEVLEELS